VSHSLQRRRTGPRASGWHRRSSFWLAGRLASRAEVWNYYRCRAGRAPAHRLRLPSLSVVRRRQTPWSEAGRRLITISRARLPTPRQEACEMMRRGATEIDGRGGAASPAAVIMSGPTEYSQTACPTRWNVKSFKIALDRIATNIRDPVICI
jgi:hypothetical protein